jgi:lysophospholipase L1-like esterase
VTRIIALAALLTAGVVGAAPRAFVSAGTSLTYGYAHDATPYPARLATLMGVPAVNMGIGGDRLATIIARWQTYAKPFPYRWSVLEGGTNDLHFDSANGTTLWATFQAWVEEALAAGHRVVIVKIPPRWGSAGWTADMETQRLAFNAAADAFVAANPSVRKVDSDTVLGTGSPVALQASFDYGDDLHLNGTGMQALAAAVRSAAL